MTEIKSKRRWFRFSLASLFLVITAICAWLSWETNQVRQRAAMTALVLSRGGTIDYQGVLRNGDDTGILGGAGFQPDRIPRTWILMGVEPIHIIAIPQGEFTSEERRKIRAAFPELVDPCLGLTAGE